MSRRDPDKPNEEPDALYRLYRDHGDVEPHSGVDRMIRARAEHAVARSRRRVAPWLGGLATASVALVALAVVLRQAPPGEGALLPEENGSNLEAPGRPSADESAGDDAVSAAPPVGARFEPGARRATEAAALESTAESRATADQAAAEPPREVQRAAAPSTPEARLAEIRALVQAGRIEQARSAFTALRERHPEFEIPEEIIARLKTGGR